ncbi:hypothetical protein [Marmoricola sp. RAF53]|uniref:hypothetical protein n=1 Tax=Marmoricola sp. RAF53 TaxID=3233059 RepID=UPI003F98D178
MSAAPTTGSLGGEHVSDYWLGGGRIVDGTGSDPVDGLSVHVHEGRIAAISASVPPGAAVLADVVYRGSTGVAASSRSVHVRIR